MKYLPQMLRWDLILLHRNQLIVISFVIAFIYLGVFYLLKELGNLENVLIIMIFNDPVVTGYLFAGVLMLLEKNQNTLDALSVSPLPYSTYLWSKAIALTLIATLTALLMAWMAHGWHMHYVHFIAGVAGTTILFVWTGCMVGIKAPSFNHLLIQSIGLLVPAGLPFFSVFGVWHHPVMYVIPSCPGILLIKAAFQPLDLWQYIYSYGYLTICLSGAFVWSKKIFQQL